MCEKRASDVDNTACSEAQRVEYENNLCLDFGRHTRFYICTHVKTQ